MKANKIRKFCLLIVALNGGQLAAQDLGASLVGVIDSTLNGSLVQDLIGELTTSSFPVVSGLTSGNGTVIESLIGIGGAALVEPQGLLASLTALGLPLAGEYSPIFGVLIDNPANALGFLLGGSGTLLSQGIAVVPGIPIVTAPLTFF